LGLRKEKKAWEPVQFAGARAPNASEFFGGTFERRSDIARLIRAGGIGVELGVARGEFSNALLENSELSYLYSIDMWAGDRSHTVEQYREAVQRLDKHRTRNSVIRLRFDEALPLFPDGYFDFIYIDGYAETGQDGGKTLEDWWPKLKPGGIFSGDDYSPKYPMVIKAVDDFSATHHLSICLIEPQVKENVYAQQPTWLCLKPDI
jgi:hypothetical protein